ncbi:MAG: DUF4258 domain-containing protein [Bryobacteraceae bacterium]
MKLHFTQHALKRMAKRQLRQEWIEQVITRPSRIEPDEKAPDLEHRLAAVPELANRVLRVIVSKAEPKRVVTVHLDRNLKGKI